MVFLLGLPIVASAMIWWAYVDRGRWPEQLLHDVNLSITASASDASWARVDVEGRDIILQGEAPDTGALHEVRRRILATPGVGNLISQTRIRAWGVLTEPTANALATQKRRPTLDGSWPANAAEGLSVELAGELYVLGESEALSTIGSAWTLTPTQELPDGRYDVEVTVWSAEISASDRSRDELTIDTTPPAAPTVERYFGRSLTPQLSGHWPVQEAARLQVEVAGRIYELGRDPQLTSTSSGRWQLDVQAPLTDGENEIIAKAYDHVGNLQTDGTTNEAFVDRDPPRAPTVDRFESSRTFTLQGTWSEGDAVGLEVQVAGKIYRLGQGDALRSVGQGQWVLTPTILPGEGTYDVVVRSYDRAGNMSDDKTQDELVIKFVPERDLSHTFEEPPRPLTAIMCQGAFKRILRDSPVRFNGRTATLKPRSVHTLDELVGVAARCPNARIEIAAHTDSEGDFAENRALSRLRALNVEMHFARRGISRTRLSSVGYGELRPIASNNTATGRAKNERLELYVKR